MTEGPRRAGRAPAPMWLALGWAPVFLKSLHALGLREVCSGVSGSPRPGICSTLRYHQPQKHSLLKSFSRGREGKTCQQMCTWVLRHAPHYNLEGKMPSSELRKWQNVCAVEESGRKKGTQTLTSSPGPSTVVKHAPRLCLNSIHKANPRHSIQS